MLDVDNRIYYFVLFLSSIVIAYATWLYIKKQYKPIQRVQRQAQQRRQGGGGVRRRIEAQERLQQRMGRAGGRAAAAAEAEAVAIPRRAEAEDSNSGSSSDEDKKDASAKKKIGVKKARKLAEKEERKKEREAEAAEREERKRQEAERLAEKRKEEAEADRLEAEKEAEEARIRAEQERREEEEYQLLKASFEVAEEGMDADADEEALKEQLASFVAYIRDAKVVFIDQLAESYQMKTVDCIDRINELIVSGDLSGVLDDRGKFIYIAPEEYEAVAKFIRQRGRVSLAELASNSGRLVNLSV